MFFSCKKIYIKKRMLIESASFELPDKGLFLLQGPNGCGKTLLLNYLFQFKIAENVDCVLIDQSSDRILKREGIISNIAFSYDLSEQKKAEGMLKELNLGHLTKHKPKHLSGGEKRIISLLRGLIKETKVCFVDEPTNDLDVNSIEMIISLLKQKAEESLVIAVSHDDRLEGIGNGTITISEGKLKSDTVIIESDHSVWPEEVENTKKQEYKSFIKNQFSYNLGFLFLVIASVFLLFIAELDISHCYHNEIPPMATDQMDICVPISSYHCGYDGGAVPISMISYLRGECNISEFAADYLRFRTMGSLSMNLNLNIPFSDRYQVFKVEYYNVKTHEFFNVWEEYILHIQNLTESNTVQVDNKQFDARDVKEYELFCEISDAVEKSDPDWKLVYCAISFKTSAEYISFLYSDEIKPNLGGNYYVKSPETISIVNAANLLIAEHELVSILMFFYTTALVLEILFSIVYVYKNRVVIRMFRNMAIPLKVQKKNIYQKTGERQFAICGMVAAVIVSISVYILYIDRSITDLAAFFIMPAVFMIYSLVIGIVNSILIKNKIERVNDWRFRC